MALSKTGKLIYTVLGFPRLLRGAIQVPPSPSFCSPSHSWARFLPSQIFSLERHELGTVHLLLKRSVHLLLKRLCAPQGVFFCWIPFQGVYILRLIFIILKRIVMEVVVVIKKENSYPEGSGLESCWISGCGFPRVSWESKTKQNKTHFVYLWLKEK